MNKEIINKKYTGREIAIFTDTHSLLEPLEASLKDMNNRKITEIYSLGDNIGVGPNPAEVIETLQEHNIVSIAGNSEEYCTLGIAPFNSYFDQQKTQSQLWTLSKLNEKHKEIIKLFPHYLELLVGGKKVALCHFANDVRIDFMIRSTWTYQNNFNTGNAYKQFLYTNSLDQLKQIQTLIDKYGKDIPMMGGYASYINDPLFAGHRVNYYDAIIQGHVHFKMYEKGESTEYYSIRANGMAYGNDPINTASYIILKEKLDGYDLEEVLVEYDREKMEHSILNSEGPMKMIKKFTNIYK